MVKHSFVKPLRLVVRGRSGVSIVLGASGTHGACDCCSHLLESYSWLYMARMLCRVCGCLFSCRRLPSGPLLRRVRSDVVSLTCRLAYASRV